MPKPIENLPPLIIGGAVFNTQYSDDPTKLPISQVIDRAFELGLNAVDTSPYYGRSEELIGHALLDLRSKHPRESYYICTKAGRVKLDDFDYLRKAVRASVLRSLERLRTDYLDLVYMHDIEFVDEKDIYGALKELKLLKDEGVILNFGISGYPVKFLLDVAKACQADAEIGSVDAVLSYSNGCIQNTRLFDLYDDFMSTGIKKLLNGSILSMSLLRLGKTHTFHPALDDLKETVANLAQELLNEESIELAELATRFALKQWLFGGLEPPKLDHNTSVVLGVQTLDELEVAWEAYNAAARGENKEDGVIVEKFQRDLGRHFNETWPSGRY